MSRHKNNPSPAVLEEVLAEASWLLSHAQALSDYGRPDEAANELARAGTCEEQAACLLEAAGREREAGIHRVSAATCYARLGRFVHAVTLLRAALASDLVDDYRREVEQQFAQSLAQAIKSITPPIKGGSRKQTSPVVP